MKYQAAVLREIGGPLRLETVELGDFEDSDEVVEDEVSEDGKPEDPDWSGNDQDLR